MGKVCEIKEEKLGWGRVLWCFVRKESVKYDEKIVLIVEKSV